MTQRDLDCVIDLRLPVVEDTTTGIPALRACPEKWRDGHCIGIMSAMAKEISSEREKVGHGSAVRSLRRRLRITPLDRLMIDALVDSRQGVVGSLSRQDVSKAVEEFVGLNGRRQQSYFHAGFRDALFDLVLDADLPARNEKRARWYWAGAIQGLARGESWDRIVEAYDSVDVVRTLGDGGDPASRMAGGLIVEALWRTGRTSELHVFVDVRLAREPNVYRLGKV